MTGLSSNKSTDSVDSLCFSLGPGPGLVVPPRSDDHPTKSQQTVRLKQERFDLRTYDN